MSTNQISTERIESDIESIGSISETAPEQGYSRPTFSEAWRRACEYVIDAAERVGGVTRIDAFGNIHITRSPSGSSNRASPPWLCGSHLDSVPSGGKYDGVMGIVVALEVFRCAPDAPLELIIFAEEEGTTFGLGMLGSRSWVGELSATELGDLRNRHGESYLEAGEAFGVSPERMSDDLLDPAAYRGMIEVHAEQGLGLWNAGLPLAAVTRINGRREFAVRFSGQGNHAGSTRMGERRDALVGAAEAVVTVESLGRRLDAERDHSVMTVGCIGVRPNAMNVIPGVAELTVDFRAQDEGVLADGEDRLRAELTEIALERNLDLSITKNEEVPPSPLDAELRARLVEAAAGLGYTMPERPSGALHDAARLASHIPAGMLFVASRDGISHDPREFSRSEDIALAAEIVLETVRR